MSESRQLQENLHIRLAAALTGSLDISFQTTDMPLTSSEIPGSHQVLIRQNLMPCPDLPMMPLPCVLKCIFEFESTWRNILPRRVAYLYPDKEKKCWHFYFTSLWEWKEMSQWRFGRLEYDKLSASSCSFAWAPWRLSHLQPWIGSPVVPSRKHLAAAELPFNALANS